MRYHYEKTNAALLNNIEIYECNHPFYNKCTLFKTGNKGLAVIQKRHSEGTKWTWWGPIDSCIANDIAVHPEFKNFLEEKAAEPDEEGLYPTFGVRRVMWVLRMKPLKREYWEYDI